MDDKAPLERLVDLAAQLKRYSPFLVLMIVFRWWALSTTSFVLTVVCRAAPLAAVRHRGVLVVRRVRQLVQVLCSALLFAGVFPYLGVLWSHGKTCSDVASPRPMGIGVAVCLVVALSTSRAVPNTLSLLGVMAASDLNPLAPMISCAALAEWVGLRQRPLTSFGVHFTAALLGASHLRNCEKQHAGAVLTLLSWSFMSARLLVWGVESSQQHRKTG